MRILQTMLLSLSILAAAWVAGRIVDKGIKVTFLHIIATPQEIKR